MKAPAGCQRVLLLSPDEGRGIRVGSTPCFSSADLERKSADGRRRSRPRFRGKANAAGGLRPACASGLTRPFGRTLTRPSPPAEARCAVHPETAAFQVCARCGAFTCGACSDLQLEALHCVRCITFSFGPASPTGPRDPWLSALGWLSLVVPLLGAVAVVAGRRRIARIRAAQAPWSQYADASTAVGLGVGSLVLWVGGPVVWLLLLGALVLMIRSPGF